MQKKSITVIMMIMVLFMLSACSNVKKDALHSSYEGDHVYGAGDYVYTAVTFTGSELDKETVYSVKELEEMAQETDLGYEGSYSMLTRGSIFSQGEFTGIKLYDLLMELGLDENADDDTDVLFISMDGYVIAKELKEIRDDLGNTYESMENEEPAEENVPVILAFGTEGVPLTGPVSDDQLGTELTEAEGYEEDINNSGGPVRLIAGQASSDDYNAPLNAKWIRKIVVGKQTDHDKHQGKEAEKECIDVVVKEKGEVKTEKSFTYADIEKFKTTAGNYYGEDNYYKGAVFWDFLASSLEFTSRDGTVELTYTYGKTEKIDVEYFRNLKGDHSGYTTEKDGRIIHNQIPALGYSVNGSPSKDGIYALLPAKKGYKDTSEARPVKSIVLDLTGDGILSENPNGGYKILIRGDGAEKETELTVNQLERNYDLMVTNGDETGFSLAGLLDETGITVDAGDVTIRGEGERTYSIDELEKKKDSILLATREQGKPLKKGGSVKVGDVEEVSEIIVDIKEGTWTHSISPYTQYADNKLSISGSAVKEKTYSLAEIEELSYSVKDSFGSAGGLNAYQGVILRELVKDNLKNESAKPSEITIIGSDGYKTEVDVDDVWEGIDSKYQSGEHRDIIIAYSINGVPLVKNEKSEGFNGENGYGPIRLIVENQNSKQVKSIREIKVEK